MGGCEIWHRLGTFGCHHWRGYYWHLVVEAWNAAKHSKVQDTPAQKRIFHFKMSVMWGGETQCEPYFCYYYYFWFHISLPHYIVRSLSAETISFFFFFFCYILAPDTYNTTQYLVLSELVKTVACPSGSP